MMSFELDFLVFLRKLNGGVSCYISYIDLSSSIEFSCVRVQDSLDIFVGVEGKLAVPVLMQFYHISLGGVFPRGRCMVVILSVFR